MKKITRFYSLIALFVSAFLSFGAQAQLPDSVAITTDGTWIIEHSYTYYGYDPQIGSYNWLTTKSFMYYRSGTDTIIGGLTYTQLLGLSIVADGNGAYSSDPFSSESYVLAYRNDMNRRAYKVDPASTTVSLWYDFNPGLGDTLWNPVAPESTPYYVVDGIDSVDYCGTMYQQFSYDDSNFQTNPSTQRVGRLINFLKSYQTPFETDRIVSFCEESIPFASIASVDEATNNVVFHLYPNPAEDVVEISMDNGVLASRVVIYDVMGNQLYDDQTGSNSISIGHLAAGNYFVSVITERGVQTQKLIKK